MVMPYVKQENVIYRLKAPVVTTTGAFVWNIMNDYALQQTTTLWKDR